MSSTTFWATLTQQQKERVMEDAVSELSSRFGWYMDGLLEALGLPELKGAERLKAYQDRTPEAWEALRMAFPQDYDKQFKEWGDMEAREMTRAPKPREPYAPQELEVPLPNIPTDPESASAILSPFRTGGTA